MTPSDSNFESKDDTMLSDADDNNGNTETNENSVAIPLSAQEQDAKTRAQIEAIDQEVRENQDLTSELFGISKLSNDFSVGSADTSSNVGFRQGCDYLATQYKSFRAVRGDGNCYYRAFLFALVEDLSKTTTSTIEFNRISQYVGASIEDVIKCGYDRFTIDMFHEEMVDLLSSVAKEREQQGTASQSSISKSLYDRLNEENGTSDYCVWFLRVITAAYLKSDPSRFIHFLDDPSYIDVATYCSKEIEPMGKECSMVGVLALAEAFGINVHIEYMDGRPLDGTSAGTKRLVKHSFGLTHDGDPSDSTLSITLLYRPGHYDILYK